MEKEITKRLWLRLWKEQKTKKRRGQRTQGKRNYQMLVVRIRINIGIVLKKIKTKGRKDVRVQRTEGSKGRKGLKDVRV
jgi:hypothetical protein